MYCCVKLCDKGLLIGIMVQEGLLLMLFKV